jgi:hypothetical chaperone protein
MRPGGEGFSRRDVLATFGVPVAGDALDGAIMRRRIAKHFGAEVTYRVPGGNNVLEMPTRLRHQLCSPADLSLLTQRDAQTFLRNVQRWSLGADDARRIEQLFVLVHDALGFALFEQIERGKRALSHDEATEVRFVYPEGADDIDVAERIERAGFEDDAAREVDAILGALDRTLERAGVSAREIDLVCCTGGSARVPKIRRGLESRFGAERIREMKSFHAVLGGLAARAREVARGANSA